MGGKLSSFYFKAKSALNINKSQKDHSNSHNKSNSKEMSFNMRNTGGSMKKSNSQGFITDQNFSNNGRDFDQIHDQRFINSNSNGPMNFQQQQSNFLGSSIRNRDNQQSGGSIQVSRSPRVGSRRFFSEERGFGSQQRLNGPIRSILKKNASGTSNGSLSPDSIRKSSQPPYNQNPSHLPDPRISQNTSSFRSSIS